MTGTLFITGTDTDCGKTVITAALARALVGQGKRVACFKPVATGCRVTPDGLRNDDAERLMAAANVDLEYATVNPWAFEPAVAPHIPAARTGIRFGPEILSDAVTPVAADFHLIEGVGGWNVPLDKSMYLPDLVRPLNPRVILAVGLKLGCLNHALLTARAIRADGFELAGWIASRVDPDMAEPDANLAALAHHLPAPRLGVVDHYDDPDAAVLELERAL